MITNLYTIFDKKANSFEPPVASENDATLVRWFTRCVDNVPNMKAFPEDFSVLRCGSFDSTTGLVSGTETLQHVCSALDCLNNNQMTMHEEMQDAQTKVGNDPSIQPSS